MSHDLSTHTLRHRSIALAAIVQSSHLVQGIACKGMADAVEIEACLSSLFATSKNQLPESMYGGLPRLRTGLVLLAKLLQGDEVNRAKELMAYTATLIALERKLSHDQSMLNQINDAMHRIEKQTEYFNSIAHENIIAALADVYAETISTIKPRIMVHGKQEYLHIHKNTNKVRALLFSGIRAAYLWRIHGGGQLQLLFRRRKLAEQTQILLRELSQ